MSDMHILSSRQTHVARAQPDRDHVTILMATWNGAATLADQLDSLLAQTHRDWSLIVSDDGSSDGSCDMIRRFQADHPDRRITLLRGPAKGSAQNFLSLLRAAGRAHWVAFCDQDDWWFPGKLSRALAALRDLDGPALYGSRTMIAGPDLTPLRLSLPLCRRPAFENALVQNIAGGNTMVLNRAALDVLQPASLSAGDIFAHDWWCYLMTTGIEGTVHIDPRPSLLYRQHAGNQIGANDRPAAALLRLKGVLEGRLADGIGRNLQALGGARRWLTPGACEQIDLLSAARHCPINQRLAALWRAGLYRQRRRGTIALWLAACLGRI
jgi:hypothetical protein